MMMQVIRYMLVVLQKDILLIHNTGKIIGIVSRNLLSTAFVPGTEINKEKSN